MTRQSWILVAAGGSLALLLGAFAFQYIGGLAPCKLCLWQRWPHGAAVVLGGIALISGAWLWPLLGALAAATTGGIAVYHSGIERKWWPGPDSCTGADVGGLSAQQLLDQIMTAPLVRCDEIPFELFGLSMANYNVLLSFGLAAIWAVAASRTA